MNSEKQWLFLEQVVIAAPVTQKWAVVCDPPRGVGQGGWEGDARGRGYGDVCIRIADSLCYTAETNTPL